MIEVEVHAIVNPTEVEEKVADSMENIFEGLEMDISKQRVTGHGRIDCLRKLHYLLREEEIIDTAYKEFRKGLSDDGLSTHFIISKQVATVGRLNFPAQEESLGSINVNIKASSSSELERLFEWLVPPTEKGVPEFEIDIEDVSE
jgi:predicted RNA binding protein with dsRBD fold (UPF0201 family)